MGLPPRKKKKAKVFHRQEDELELDLPPLGKEQQEALEKTIAFIGDSKKELFLLEGYAGTGKSTLCRHLITKLEGKKVALAAPTNKAVGVLKELSWDLPGKIPAATLHHWLNLALIENRQGEARLESMGEHRLSGIDLLVVDECSMINSDLWQGLQDLFEGRPKLKVLLMGDPAQLPPVGEEISPSFLLKDRAQLTEVFRQGSDHPILSYSMKLREAMVSVEEELPRPEEAPERLVLHRDEDSWLKCALDSFSQTEVGKQRSGIRILAYTNQRVARWNRRVQGHLFRDLEGPFDPSETLILKEPLGARRMDGFWYRQLSTDDEVRLTGWRELEWEGVPIHQLDVQGPEGKIFSLKHILEKNREPWEKAVEKKRQHCAEHPFEWPAFDRVMDSVTAIQSAFAMTVHRCQGSTFNRVFIDLPSFKACQDWPMKLRLLYVAISRSRTRVDLLWPE